MYLLSAQSLDSIFMECNHATAFLGYKRAVLEIRMAGYEATTSGRLVVDSVLTVHKRLISPRFAAGLVIALLNRYLFGFAIHRFRNFDLQQAVLVGCFDVLGIYIHGQSEASLEFSIGSFPLEIVVFFNLIVRDPFTFQGQDPVFDIHFDVFLVDTGKFSF